MPERRVAIPIAPDPVEKPVSTGSSIGDFIAQHSGMFRTRFQKLKSIIPIVLLLLLMDVFALLWVGSWLDKHNEDGYLRGILPGWKSAVSSFQACVIGDEVTDNAWGGAILARMAHESDYRAMVSEVCYPKYQTEIARLDPPGEPPPLHMFQEWYATTDSFAEVAYLDMDSMEATHLCKDLVVAADWLRTSSQKLHDTAIPPREIHCGVGRLSSLDGGRVMLPEPASPLDPVWADIRMPLSRRTPWVQDGVLYGDYQETHDSNARVSVRTEDGKTWDAVPYTQDLKLGPIWSHDFVWGVGRSASTGDLSVQQYQGGQWQERARLPKAFRPEVLGTSKRARDRVVVGRTRNPIGDRFDVLYSTDHGHTIGAPVSLMECSGVRMCYPELHVAADGSVVAINVEQIGFQLGVETHYLASATHRAQSRILTLPGVRPQGTRAQVDTCFDGKHQWVLVNGEMLLASGTGGRQWQRVQRFTDGEVFGDVQMDCKFGSIALAGPARGAGYPGLIRHTVCNASTRCLPVETMTEFRSRSMSVQLTKSGLLLLMELYPQHNLLAYHDARLNGHSHLMGFASISDLDSTTELPVRRLENHWFVYSEPGK